MARLARLFAPGVPQLILQRGRGGAAIATDAESFDILEAMLSDAVRAYGVALHAYVLLPDRFLLLVNTPSAAVLSRFLQSLGRRYVQYFNQRHQRQGSLWDQRYRSALIQAEHVLLTAIRYLELAPMRQGLSPDAAHYPWSSYGHHSGIRPCSFLTDPAAYWALGNTPFERQAVYKDRANQPLTLAELTSIEAAVQGGWALGDEAFLARVAQVAGRRIRPLARGRPRKDPATQP